jgi:hypothetical protein
MSRLYDALRKISIEHLSWFGAGLGVAGIALVAMQLFGTLVDPPTAGLPRVEVVQAASESKPTRTPFASATPWPTRTPLPTATPWPTRAPRDTPTPRPTATPWPTRTPRPTATPRDTPTPWPTRTPFPAREPTLPPEFDTDVDAFADRITDLAAALSRASARLACRTPVVPSASDARASQPCG